MGVDVAIFRARVGAHYSRSIRHPHLLSFDNVLFINLYMYFGCKAVAIYLMIDLSKYDICTFLGKYKGRSHYDTRKPKSIKYFSILVMIFIQIGLYIFLLIYRSCDVELNPGPTSHINDLSDCSTDQGYPSISRRYKEMVSFSCLNVQSLRQKVDIVEAELGVWT